MLGWERWRWSPNSLGTPNLFFVFLSLNSIIRAPSDVAMSGKIQNLCNVWGKIRLWYEDNLIWQKLHCVVVHFSIMLNLLRQQPGLRRRRSRWCSRWSRMGALSTPTLWPGFTQMPNYLQSWDLVHHSFLKVNYQQIKHVRMERDMKPRYLSLIFSSCPLLNT